MKALFILLTILVSASSFASGWNCYGKDYRVKLVNHTDATKVPAVLVVSHVEQGTLLTAKDEEITKETQKTGTYYGAKKDHIYVSLFVAYREGKDLPLKKGEKVNGTVSIADDDAVLPAIALVCRRY